MVIATALGSGLSPFAPGTAGSLLAIPLTYWTVPWDTTSRLILWCALFIVGVWSARVMDEKMGTSDNSHIVIDEVVGMGIATWLCGPRFIEFATAFLLFRFFDILKPPPIRQLDGWSKKKAQTAGGRAVGYWWSGFGVMADDVLAGLAALLVFWLFRKADWL